jgi:hypothetical protein
MDKVYRAMIYKLLEIFQEFAIANLDELGVEMGKKIIKLNRAMQLLEKKKVVPFEFS